jgi:hypothetical protein
MVRGLQNLKEIFMPTMPGGSGTGSKGSPTDFNYNWLYGGAAGAAIPSLFGMYKNPFDEANPYMQQGASDIGKYYNQAIGFLSPYRQAGQFGLGGMMQGASEMSDPSSYYNRLTSGFQMSPAQQYSQQQGLGAVSNNAATRGLLGSPQMGQDLIKYAATDTGNQQQQYLQNLLGIKNQSLQQYGNLGNMGLSASGQSGQFGMQAGQMSAEMQEALAQMAAAQAQGQNTDLSSAFGGLGGLAGLMFL